MIVDELVLLQKATALSKSGDTARDMSEVDNEWYDACDCGAQLLLPRDLMVDRAGPPSPTAAVIRARFVRERAFLSPGAARRRDAS